MLQRLNQKLQLQQRLSQRQIHSLQLLQLPALELEQLIRQQLELNPLLEELPQEESEKQEENLSSEKEREPEEEKELDSDFDEVDWSEYLADGFEMGYPMRQGRTPDEDRRQPVAVSQPSLTDHLLQQLRFAFSSPEELRIGEAIVGNIDPDGYLTCSVQQIASALNVPETEVERVLSTIQTFDPPGVGARDLRECLAIQLRELGEKDGPAMKIVQFHLEDLKRHRYRKIAESLKLTEEQIRKAFKVISGLTPRPGAASFGSGARQITPDLIVEKMDDEYVVMLNDKSIPTLRINPVYLSLLKGSKISDEERKYVLERLNSARWLISAIDQRRSTMLRLMRFIVERQRDFFDHGVSSLKPMVLQDAADALQLHPSTISRVTNGKYVQTPHGIFELRYFFDSKIDSTSGQSVSSKTVMERIRQLIEAEDPQNPLSDQQVAELLNKEGFNIARRTVSKYRNRMRIPSAAYRKKL
ncbi:MAG: RNA polymerase factor sigma-54 [Candidatus Latescibacteria bacterium]|nr:RNA polymerase factor sigma-54 [Candidatus Latescibacterota bacterium]